MAGQAIEYQTSQGHTHNFTVCHPHLNAQNVSAEPSFDEARRANWQGVGTPEILSADEHRRCTRLRLQQLSRIAREAELSASIVHQLSQPLTSMLANAQAAARWLEAEPPNLMEATASVDRIARDARSASHTMERIRALFKQEPFDKREASVPDIMSDAVRQVREDPKKRDVPVVWRFGENLPKVCVDPLAIQEVFINLTSNAMEAVENTKSPLVEIRAAATDQNVMLVQVIDNGPGVSETARIFDAFVTTKKTGLGIGLAVSRSIAEAHGGRLWAENNPSGGATFCLALPLCSSTRISPGA